MYSDTVAQTVIDSSGILSEDYASKDGEYELTLTLLDPNGSLTSTTSIILRVYHDDCSPNLIQDSTGYSPPVVDYYVGYKAMTVVVPEFSSGTCKVLSKLEVGSSAGNWKDSRFTWIKEDQTTTVVPPYSLVFTQTPLQYKIKTDSTDDIGEYLLRATLWRVGATDDFADAREVLTGRDVPTFKVRIQLSPEA